MKVEQIMNVDTKVCRPYEALNRAAQIMWENRCGAVPVVDERDHPVGFLTDRDICMAAYTQDKPLSALRVDHAMAHDVVCCKGDDELISAAELMRQHGKRRLPCGERGGCGDRFAFARGYRSRSGSELVRWGESATPRIGIGGGFIDQPWPGIRAPTDLVRVGSKQAIALKFAPTFLGPV